MLLCLIDRRVLLRIRHPARRISGRRAEPNEEETTIDRCSPRHRCLPGPPAPGPAARPTEALLRFMLRPHTPTSIFMHQRHAARLHAIPWADALHLLKRAVLPELRERERHRGSSWHARSRDLPPAGGRRQDRPSRGMTGTRPTAAASPSACGGTENRDQGRVRGRQRSRTSAPSRIRTYDTRFRKPMLYPLSYEGAPGRPPADRVRSRFSVEHPAARRCCEDRAEYPNAATWPESRLPVRGANHPNGRPERAIVT